MNTRVGCSGVLPVTKFKSFLQEVHTSNTISILKHRSGLPNELQELQFIRNLMKDPC